MTSTKTLKTILIWLPSLILTAIFIPNALHKIFQSDQLDKIISNPLILISVGIVLLIGTLLFLMNKTLLWGTTILSLYMTCIVFIHMYKGKPYEIVLLIVMSTIFAAYLRKPEVFKKE